MCLIYSCCPTNCFYVQSEDRRKYSKAFFDLYKVFTVKSALWYVFNLRVFA